MEKKLTNNDINWIKSLIINNNTTYNYEFEIRFLNIDEYIYADILDYFENMLKDKKYNLKKKVINICEEIKYSKNFNLIKRIQNNKKTYITKKKIKWKYLDNLPANINLSTELICNKTFNIDNNFIKRSKKRTSFFNDYISYYFTIINDKDYSIELEILNLKYSKNIDIIINYINEILHYIPTKNYILHKLNFLKIKNIIKQPKPLKNEDIIKNNFYVTAKYDGIRSILYINENDDVFLIKNSFRDIIYTNLTCKNIKNTIIDGELIDNKIFYAIDLIIYDNIFRNFNLEKRIELLRSIKFKHKESKNKDIYYKIKKYYPIELSKKIYKKEHSYILNKNKYKIPVDGLIFNSIKEEYKECIIFKWKQHITFDFKIKKVERNNDNISWRLYCYSDNKKEELFPIKNYGITYVSLEIDKLYKDNDVVEFIFNKNKKIFEPIKPRYDKLLPNFIDIALDNWYCLSININF